jgi:hypothetical protein
MAFAGAGPLYGDRTCAFDACPPSPRAGPPALPLMETGRLRLQKGCAGNGVYPLTEHDSPGALAYRG